MGRYLGKCKGVMGEIAVVGVKTRARAALAMAAAATSVSSLPEKKIKKATAATTRYSVRDLRSRRRVSVVSEDNSAASLPSCRPETTTPSSDVVVVVEAAANCSGGDVRSNFPASCCSSNNASSYNEMVKDRFEIIADPEVESGQTSSRRLNCHDEARKENTGGVAESGNLDSHRGLPDAKSTVQNKTPPNAEIEEFFATAEKEIQKRFTEKYNFDIVKDVALEGRYEWVPMKP